jgi:hypothetical protein
MNATYPGSHRECDKPQNWAKNLDPEHFLDQEKKVKRPRPLLAVTCI